MLVARGLSVLANLIHHLGENTKTPLQFLVRNGQWNTASNPGPLWVAEDALQARQPRDATGRHPASPLVQYHDEVGAAGRAVVDERVLGRPLRGDLT